MAFPRSAGFRILLATVALAVVAGAVGAVAFYVVFVRDLPDLRDVRDYQPALASTVLDRQGRPIGEFFTERRRLTPLSEVPQHVIDAFVAGEDATFFEHAGIDYVSILRAAWVNLRAGGEIKQGASTITQQMVKGLLLTPERNFTRKIREMILAHRIEQRFSKQDILFLYLNQIYLGDGAYGIGEAARGYYGKEVSELSVSEGAQLAGLPKAPSRYSPVGHPEAAERRRRYVLERMLAEGLLDGAGYEMALADVPVLAPRGDPPDYEVASYFTEEVRRRLFDELGGDTVLTGGLVIETTLDLDLERAAVAAVRRGVRELDRRQGYRGPLRQVERADIDAEIEKLAARNELAPAEEDAAAPALAPGRDYEGIAVEVDPQAGRARIAFAPDVTGVVEFADLRWTRVPRGPLIRRIDQVLAVGDVALFELPPVEAGEQPAERETAAAPRVLLTQKPAAQSALLSIDVESDEVVAMVGGYDFEDSEFNRVTQARRQPGSAFKPLIYSAALMKGYTPVSILYDRPVVYTDEESGFVWRPRNYKGEFNGPITMREALARSINNATVHLFRDVGVDFVIDYARLVGIESPLNRDLSLALGSSDLTLFELTRAYAVFPSGGRRSDPVFIRRVTDHDGEVILENATLAGGFRGQRETAEENGDPSERRADAADAPAAPAGPELSDEFLAVRAGFGEFDDPDQLISPELAYLTTSLLRAVVTEPRGTGRQMRELGRPVAGKTGTTNDQADAWFMGFSPELVTGVWVGHDETRVLGYKETGGRAAAPIWRYFMADALRNRPVRDFPVPDAIVFARVDRTTGLLADVDSRNIIFQAFLPGTEPKERAEAARTSAEGRRMLRLDDF